VKTSNLDENQKSEKNQKVVENLGKFSNGILSNIT
jgi:hypothetical protein